MIKKAYKELAKKKKPVKKVWISTQDGVSRYRTKSWFTPNGKDNLKEVLRSD